jgi:hypothetical protein
MAESGEDDAAFKNRRRNAMTRGKPFEAGNPGGPGRPRGSKSKSTEVQEHLLAAFERCVVEGGWDDLVQAAVKQAKDGRCHLLTAILPFVARKMPSELVLHPAAALSPEEIEKKWALRQDLAPTGALPAPPQTQQ